MNYPITTDDIVIDTHDDEHATVIVIEALTSHSYDDIELTDEMQRDKLRNDVLHWNRYDEYVAIISNQKKLLNKAIGDSGTFDNIVDPTSSDVSNLINKAQNRFDEKISNCKTKKTFTVVSVAASILLITALSATLISRSNRSSGTKSASRTSSGDSLSSTNKGASNGASNDSASNAPESVSKSMQEMDDQHFNIVTLPHFEDSGALTDYVHSNKFANKIKSSTPTKTSKYNDLLTSDSCSQISTPLGSGTIYVSTLGDDNTIAFVAKSSEPIFYDIIVDCDIVASTGVS